MSPIYIRKGGLSYGWFSNEAGEPCHVHVFKGSDRNSSAKFWVSKDNVELANNNARLSQKELKEAYDVILRNRYRLIAQWMDSFGN